MRTKKVFISVLSLLLLAGCISEDEGGRRDNGSTTSSITANFSAEISAIPTRAKDSRWDSGDEVGIFMVRHKTTEIFGTAANRLYTNIGDGGTANFIAVDTIYLPDTEEEIVDFIAYYPYRANQTLATYEVNVGGDQNVEGRMAIYDLLYVNTKDRSPSGYDRTNPDIRFVFHHQLTKLIVTLTVEVENVTNNAITATLTGAKTVRSFNLATGTFGEESDVKSDVSLHQVTGNGDLEQHFEAIVVPQGEVAGRRLSFSWVDNLTNQTRTQHVDLPQYQTWESGKSYEYLIRLSNTEAQLAGFGALEDWDEGSSNRVSSLTYHPNIPVPGMEDYPTYSQRVFTDIPYPLDTNRFVCKGYTFIGWSEGKDEADVENILPPGFLFTCTGDAILYAQWIASEPIEEPIEEPEVPEDPEVPGDPEDPEVPGDPGEPEVPEDPEDPDEEEQNEGEQNEGEQDEGEQNEGDPDTE